MKYWISKYALELGIVSTDVPDVTGMTSKQVAHDVFGTEHVHTTRSAAIVAAEEMRTKKIASLRKQIERLERLHFDDKL